MIAEMPPFLANSNEYMHGQSKNQVGYDMGQTCKSHSYWKQNTLCPKIGRTVDKDEHLFFRFYFILFEPQMRSLLLYMTKLNYPLHLSFDNPIKDMIKKNYSPNSEGWNQLFDYFI